ncbi:hypothetical protein C8R31_10489 [Nitrosospira sp. Nsp2]|uniref:hypothetical protein n=1 Tax=Nitrosospira sp. Nsp2 TaxID=136548 RepID=UPI000D300EDB|nr:hypothetical protein [Nitrosospira sp. Nsp2]PTR15062.1 hypothetical protein C8R31_10489 [Nitrosospira sp. Nsp2]
MSAPEIDYKQLGMDSSLYASEELENAAKVLAVMLETMGEPEREIIRKYPALVVGLARLTHADALAHEVRLKAALAEDRPEPTEREKSIIYRALEADLLFGDHRPAHIEEMDAALSRFKKIAGL